MNFNKHTNTECILVNFITREKIVTKLILYNHILYNKTENKTILKLC